MAIEPGAELQIILVVTTPLPGVVHAVQHGRDGLLPPCASTPQAISFALTVPLGPALADGGVNYRGPFAQGAPSERFVYVNTGTYAGQPDTPWARRAKVKLGGIPRHLVEAAAGHADRAVEGRFHGLARDGGPVCASVPPHAIEWRLVERPGG